MIFVGLYGADDEFLPSKSLSTPAVSCWAQKPQALSGANGEESGLVALRFFAALSMTRP